MKILAWNCRGLGNQLAIPTLRLLLRQQDPDLVFLSETKLQQQEFERLRFKVYYDNGFNVSCCDKRGGLGLLWRSSLDIEVLSSNNNMIDVWIKKEEEGRSSDLQGSMDTLMYLTGVDLGKSSRIYIEETSHVG